MIEVTTNHKVAFIIEVVRRIGILLAPKQWQPICHCVVMQGKIYIMHQLELNNLIGGEPVEITHLDNARVQAVTRLLVRWGVINPIQTQCIFLTDVGLTTIPYRDFYRYHTNYMFDQATFNTWRDKEIRGEK